ncbi:DUF4352 domain-containing protein [Alicyclobacillus sp. SO9]|uniref:DUF4352 domain-containing protein n=1 Tax=Alicyclobacillus sp. SO9 TaxID=2665646 RepID=UPI0018E87130|nr:DUF4352 domain-containing protein [Alicyclobacillus sp. SO9]QQE78096.1 DUF4352 domain-containing protein [Alicyclobacillus sp. SO9]
MKTKLVLLSVALPVLLVAGCGTAKNAATTGSTKTTTNSAKKKTTEPKKTAVKMGQWATAGKLTFKVNSMKYESKLPESSMGAPSANGGKWLILNVSIKNKDSKTRTIDTTMFKLFKGKTSYNASSEADIFINKNSSFFLKQLNSGLSAKGNIAFNVPKKETYQLQVGSGMFESTTKMIELKK